MTSLLFSGQENVGLRVPPGKDRQRLKSAPELHAAKDFKTLRTPLQTPYTPLHPVQSSLKKPTLTPQCRVEKQTPPCAAEEVPDKERMFPYRPDDFEQYGLVDGVVYISCLPLAGVPRSLRQPAVPEVDDITLEPCDPLPFHPTEEHGALLEDFLLTLDELTVDLPPPPEDLPEF